MILTDDALVPPTPSLSSPADSQRGVALLTILLLVVSITIVAGSMLASQKIVIRQSGLLFNQDQLLQDINAGQQLAITLIRADDNLNKTDSAQDIWAQPLPPYTLGSHSITTELRDEASRFNINNLYYNGQVDSDALAVFQRLLSQLNLDPEIAIAVLDWQDTDSEVYQDGGDESAVYTRAEGGSKTLLNQSLVSIDQLQEVRGINAEVLATLRPYITAVPYFLPININTASPVLLAALMEDASSDQIQALIDLRAQNALKSVDEIGQLPALGGSDTEQSPASTSLLAVDSQAFLALITATDTTSVGTAKQRFATVLISKTSPSSNEDELDNRDLNGNNLDSNDLNSNDLNSNNLEATNPANSSTSESNLDDDEPKTIKVISQRLWAFRPAF